MTKLDYLKLAILQYGCVSRMDWLVSAFAIFNEGPDDWKKDPYKGRIVRDMFGFSFFDGTELIKIEDADKEEPLFAFRLPVTADSTWFESIKSPVETKVGNLIYRAVVIEPTLGKNYPFTAGKLSVANEERYIAANLTSKPPEGATRDPSKVYTDDYRLFRTYLQFLEGLAPITNWAITRKGLTAAPGLAKARKELALQYGDRINDPVVMAEYESKLKEIDREWLKDDPSYGTFLKGKVLDISRKKMFIGFGLPPKLDPTVPNLSITQTLEEGLPTDRKSWSVISTGARFGSQSRGTETINGGVVAKKVVRAGNNHVIVDGDCGTSVGIIKTYNQSNISTLVGRSIILNKKVVLIENNDDAMNYLGRQVMVRSPRRCKQGPGDVVCRVCAGERLWDYKEGLIIPFTEFSNIILNSALKAMHGKVLATAEVNLDEVLS